jgi:Prohead core protein serine protease
MKKEMSWSWPVQIMRADVPNGNGRVYPRATLESVVEQAKAKPPLGHLGVPEGPTVELGKVSHTVGNLRLEGDYLVGDITVLDTPKGRVLMDLLDTCQFRASGTGMVSEDGVVTEFQLISIDAVSDPTPIF